MAGRTLPKDLEQAIKDKQFISYRPDQCYNCGTADIVHWHAYPGSVGYFACCRMHCGNTGCQSGEIHDIHWGLKISGKVLK